MSAQGVCVQGGVTLPGGVQGVSAQGVSTKGSVQGDVCPGVCVCPGGVHPLDPEADSHCMLGYTPPCPLHAGIHTLCDQNDRQV